MTTIIPTQIIRVDRDNLLHLYTQDDVPVTTKQVAAAADVIWRVLSNDRCSIHGSSDTGLWKQFFRHYGNLEYTQAMSLFNAAVAQLQTAGELLVEVIQQLNNRDELTDELVIYRLGCAPSSG